MSRFQRKSRVEQQQITLARSPLATNPLRTGLRSGTASQRRRRNLLKSLDPDSGCRDIAISNCVLSSRCYAFKIGTATAGFFENIVVRDCSISDSREGIGIQTVDGARVENILVSNLVLRNIRAAAISIRHGARDRSYRREATINRSVLRNVKISNIQGTGVGRIGNSIVGLAGRPVENVVLSDIRLTSVGGGTAEDGAREIAELPRSYPKSEMFGTLPAHGFFLRHTRGVRFTNVHFELLESDARPAIVAIASGDLEINGLKTSPRMTSPQAVIIER